MREESCSLQQQCVATTEASSISKQRKKRKWDQPDESLVSCGVALSGMLPTGSVGFSGVSLPGAVSVSCAPSTNSVNHASIQASVVQQQAAVLVQKLNQPKIQEDLIIAREIIINDADPAMRYKLTKRLTQEEIQKSTGAVVITRGKYRPPNAAPDGEKPLYLHISAGTHIKETAERILAVDRAAAMVEDMLKQVSQPLSTCVYLGFDADPSVNIAARIRGPNDQYINHIINETGATLVLRGRGSGYLDTQGEGDQQPLHLLLSSNNQKSLEDAKLLAENLLDTISRECGANRISCKVYNAVPPPQQLLVGIQSSGTAMHSNLSSASSMASFAATSLPSVPALSVVAPVVPTAFSYGQVVQPGASYPLGHAQTNGLPCSQSSLTACTSYSAYAGLYPQATPLQQVALTLRQSSPISSTVSPATSATREMPKSLTESEKRKRKFQESPASLKGVAISQQVLSLTSMKLTGQYYGSLYWTVFTGFASSVGSAADEAIKESDRQDLRCPSSLENNRKDPISLKSLLPPPLPRSSSSMPNPPKSMLAPPSPQPKSMHPRPPPPPPPPKFDSPVSVNTANDKDKFSNGSSFPTVPDTLVRLMEYGDDDDDTDAEECDNESCTNVAKQDCPSKPFWAV